MPGLAAAPPRAKTYSSTVPAYSSAGMIVDAVNRVTSAEVWVRSASVMIAPMAAASTVAQDGPAGRPGHLPPELVARQPLVPGHREDQPAVGDHDDQAAGEDRDADEDEEDLLHRAAEHVLHDEAPPARSCRWPP